MTEYRLGARSMTITSSRERIASMIEIVKEIAGGKESNVFLFADFETAHGADPLTIAWKSGKDTHIQLALRVLKNWKIERSTRQPDHELLIRQIRHTVSTKAVLKNNAVTAWFRLGITKHPVQMPDQYLRT